MALRYIRISPSPRLTSPFSRATPSRACSPAHSEGGPLWGRRNSAPTGPWWAP